MRNIYRVYFFILLVLTMVFGFQNCGQIDLAESNSSNLSYSKLNISGSLCLDQGFNLKSLFVTNISMKPDAQVLQIDADRDGLSDSFERTHGFDPNQPRSRGLVLDGVCFYLTRSNDCRDLEVFCEGKVNELGISDCDINAMNLQRSASSQLGIDSDGDSIPDRIELLFELDPAIDDALLDYDNDQIKNIDEVLQSSHPRQARSTGSQFQLSDRLITQKVAPIETNCSGEEWGFLSKNHRVYKLGGRSSADLESNHFLIIALSERVRSSLDIDRKMYFIFFQRNYQKIDEDLTFATDDFQVADNNFFKGEE